MSGRAGREAAGRLAERAAAVWLRLKGYRLLARRFRTPVGEIDLVLARGDLLVFVEVKARAEEALALAALGPRQRRRIARAAEWFLRCRPELAGRPCRFDLVTIQGLRPPRHLKDAWRLD